MAHLSLLGYLRCSLHARCGGRNPADGAPYFPQLFAVSTLRNLVARFRLEVCHVD
jgi:hypothetical protein